MDNKIIIQSKKPSRRRRTINKSINKNVFQQNKSSPLVNNINNEEIVKNDLTEQYKILVPIKKQKIREYVTSNDDDMTTSPSCSQMDYQKPVKVKSRWTQSCQMEMMMEESQSSLDTSDAVTDISVSDLNEMVDCNSEFKTMEVRRSSRRSGSSRTDYRQLLGLKRTLKETKKQINPKSLKSNRGRKKKQPLQNLFNTEKQIETKNNSLTSLDDNIIKQSIIDWNIITVWGSSKSVNEELPRKPVRRYSLTWNFKFKSKNIPEVKRNVDKNICQSSTIPDKKLDQSENELMRDEPLFTNCIPPFENNETDCAKEFKPNFDLSQEFCNLGMTTIKYSEVDEGMFNKVSMRSEQSKILVDTINQKNHNEKDIMALVETKESSTNHSLCYSVNVTQENGSESSKYSSLANNNQLYVQSHNTFQFRSKSVDSVIYSERVNRNNYNSLKRYKSYDCVKTWVTSSKSSHIPIKNIKSSRKNRRKSKRLKPKHNIVDLFDDLRVPDINYNEVANKIKKEHEQQLLEARCSDQEFDDSLKAVNFSLINENMYRPDRQTMKAYTTIEISRLRKLKQRIISGDINVFCECTLTKEDIIERKIGCDDQCLNRLLKIECGSSCSLKRYCSNKQFQNKQFKRTQLIKTENKGYGICALEDIPKGALIYEYVGEVIDYNEMCNRLKKKMYKNLNYMVQLNSDEIIDSTSRGNVTRFINHSCDPNSIGEKWHVLGQSRMGFFSTRPIKKGEEITFDYGFQVFGDGAQVCYCGSSKCRGYISKASQVTDLNSSDESDVTDDNNLLYKSEKHLKRTRTVKKRIVINEKNKLRELSHQLTEISKLKTGLKADQEMATLILNRLMVHISDTVSRLYILKFIRENDMNCKRLFMDFNGLSIIHNWMTSNENESFKSMILEMLAELPITNRNTITKSKVIDVVAEWAQIPPDVKSKIESLEYSALEIDNILPNNSNGNDEFVSFVKKAQTLWKKWIVLKLVFKIPKKLDQPKTVKPERNPKNVIEDNNSQIYNISTERKQLRTPNKDLMNKSRPTTLSSVERYKMRKEYEQKIEHDRKEIFRKKVMEDWLKKRETVMKNAEESRIQHQQKNNGLNCEKSVTNHNDIHIMKRTRWDCPTQMFAQIVSNPILNMQTQCLNYGPTAATKLQLPLMQAPHHMHFIPPNLNSSNIVNFSTTLNTSPPTQLSRLPFTIQPQIILPAPSLSSIPLPPTISFTKTSLQSPTQLLRKSVDAKSLSFIRNSLIHHSKSNQKTSTEHLNESSKKITTAVQSGVDLLARVKVISNSFRKQPSKLIKMQKFKQKQENPKPQQLPLSDASLMSVCDKSKRVIFYNEQENIASNSCIDLIQVPTTVPLNNKNNFANAILNSLLKKAKTENKTTVPKNFVIKNLNAEVVTCSKVDKEIELYKKLKTKMVKKVVGSIKTNCGVISVVKKKLGGKLKRLNDSHNKVAATKRNMMRKGNIHRIALKNCLVKTKSALKRQTDSNSDDHIRRPKEKRVTFFIEGESNQSSSSMDIRPINLNQNFAKQKPLMKCHPFEIRNEPKLLTTSILQPSTSYQENLLPVISYDLSVQQTNNDIISPIVARFKASRHRRTSIENMTIDLEELQKQRKHSIPPSMTSLSVDVLKLIPDNKNEMKKIAEYHYLMANVIVRILGPYAKTTCQQGRIKNNDDFKYLAKKINENILLKELQLKKVDKLKITLTTEEKVTEYIRKYMLRFGEVYKRKSTDHSNHHKSKST